MKKLLSLTLLGLIFIAGCSKSDEDPSYAIDQTSINIHFDEQHQFRVKLGNNDVKASELTWSSSDESVGTINSSGFFEAAKIGSTTITAMGEKQSVQAEVIVTPYSTLCNEPFLKFGSSVATVKSNEKRVLLTEVENGLIFKGENAKLREVIYLFEGGKMASTALLIANSEAVIQESASFLAERYTPVGAEEEYFYFSDLKTVVIAVTFHESLGFAALYVPYTPSVAQAVASKDIQSLNNLRLRTLKKMDAAR